MKKIPDSHIDLLSDEKKAFAFLGTLKADGTAQVTPIWFNTSGDFILINSAEGRLKDKNMRARPNVTLCISDPTNPYRYLQISGRVVEITEKGAAAHIDALAGKYTGNPKYQNHQPGISRVTYKIQPEKVDAHG
jgi:PPOX class probable F420-dependent enzyme